MSVHHDDQEFELNIEQLEERIAPSGLHLGVDAAAEEVDTHTASDFQFSIDEALDTALSEVQHFGDAQFTGAPGDFTALFQSSEGLADAGAETVTAEGLDAYIQRELDLLLVDGDSTNLPDTLQGSVDSVLQTIQELEEAGKIKAFILSEDTDLFESDSTTTITPYSNGISVIEGKGYEGYILDNGYHHIQFENGYGQLEAGADSVYLNAEGKQISKEEFLTVMRPQYVYFQADGNYAYESVPLYEGHIDSVNAQELKSELESRGYMLREKSTIQIVNGLITVVDADATTDEVVEVTVSEQDDGVEFVQDELGNGYSVDTDGNVSEWHADGSYSYVAADYDGDGLPDYEFEATAAGAWTSIDRVEGFEESFVPADDYDDSGAGTFTRTFDTGEGYSQDADGNTRLFGYDINHYWNMVGVEDQPLAEVFPGEAKVGDIFLDRLGEEPTYYQKVGGQDWQEVERVEAEDGSFDYVVRSDTQSVQNLAQARGTSFEGGKA